jgi:hypothetical protein
MRMIASIASLTGNFWERIKTPELFFKQFSTSDAEADFFVYRTFAISQILLYLP